MDKWKALEKVLNDDHENILEKFCQMLNLYFMLVTGMDTILDLHIHH